MSSPLILKRTDKSPQHLIHGCVVEPLVCDDLRRGRWRGNGPGDGSTAGWSPGSRIHPPIRFTPAANQSMWKHQWAWQEPIICSDLGWMCVCECLHDGNKDVMRSEGRPAWQLIFFFWYLYLMRSHRSYCIWTAVSVVIVTRSGLCLCAGCSWKPGLPW